jgi:hypothetical protein
MSARLSGSSPSYQFAKIVPTKPRHVIRLIMARRSKTSVNQNPERVIAFLADEMRCDTVLSVRGDYRGATHRPGGNCACLSALVK